MNIPHLWEVLPLHKKLPTHHTNLLCTPRMTRVNRKKSNQRKAKKKKKKPPLLQYAENSGPFRGSPRGKSPSITVSYCLSWNMKRKEFFSFKFWGRVFTIFLRTFGKSKGRWRNLRCYSTFRSRLVCPYDCQGCFLLGGNKCVIVLRSRRVRCPFRNGFVSLGISFNPGFETRKIAAQKQFEAGCQSATVARIRSRSRGAADGSPKCMAKDERLRTSCPSFWSRTSTTRWHRNSNVCPCQTVPVYSGNKLVEGSKVVQID